MACPSAIIGAVPLGSVLIAQEHEGSALAAGRHARFAQQHECEQPGCLRLVGHQFDQRARQPHCLASQRDPCRIIDPSIVDQVQHGQHRAESPREVGCCRYSIGNVGGLDLVLGADEALDHGRLAHQKRAGDLVHTQAAQ